MPSLPPSLLSLLTRHMLTGKRGARKAGCRCCGPRRCNCCVAFCAFCCCCSASVLCPIFLPRLNATAYPNRPRSNQYTNKGLAATRTAPAQAATRLIHAGSPPSASTVTIKSSRKPKGLSSFPTTSSSSSSSSSSSPPPRPSTTLALIQSILGRIGAKARCGACCGNI